MGIFSPFKDKGKYLGRPQQSLVWEARNAPMLSRSCSAPSPASSADSPPASPGSERAPSPALADKLAATASASETPRPELKRPEQGRLVVYGPSGATLELEEDWYPKVLGRGDLGLPADGQPLAHCVHQRHLMLW